MWCLCPLIGRTLETDVTLCIGMNRRPVHSLSVNDDQRRTAGSPKPRERQGDRATIVSRGGHVPSGRTRRSFTGRRVAGEIGLHGKGLRGRAMHKSFLSPTGLGLLLWKATCRETCPCRLGRGQWKRTVRHLAGALLHSEGARRRRSSHATSPAGYPTRG